MPKTITIRFFRVGKMHQAGPSLRASLDKIYATGEPGKRERQLSGAFRCRLERYEASGGLLRGEMTRVRDSDFPSEVHPYGTSGLGVDVPIGDGIVFCFREADHILAIEYGPRTLSPGRFADYISSMDPNAVYTLEPSIDRMALERFRAQPLRKVEIRIAGVQHLEEVENAAQPVAGALQHLGEQYNAPMVTVALSMGNAKGELAEGAKQMVEGFLRMAGRGDDIRSLRATPDAGEGERNEDINLLDQLLSIKAELVLPNKEPEKSYIIRLAHLMQQLEALNV